MNKFFLLPLLSTMSLTVSALAQTPPVSSAPQPPSEARQFDFWIGEWDVTKPDGTRAGTNRIEPIARERGLLESWTGAGGSTGRSLNAYNAAKKQWQQFWVGSDGTVLELSGGLDADGRMVLVGESVQKNQRVRDRITWTPNADGTVRQFWEQSRDDGKTWTVAFDGLYRRKKS